MSILREGSWRIRDGTVERIISARYYEVPASSLEIRALQRTNGQLDRPGANASFFHGGNMTAIHWFRGSAVRAGGDTNVADAGAPNTAMSCMYWTAQNPSNVVFNARLANISELARVINLSDIGWAIGGFSLLLNENHNGLDSMIARYRTLYSGMNVSAWIPFLERRRARAFIGYNIHTNSIIFGVMSTRIHGEVIDDNLSSTSLATGMGATYFDMYTILRQLGCTVGLSLDGGGTTRIRRPVPAGTTPIQSSALSDPGRDARCQLTFTGAPLN